VGEETRKGGEAIEEGQDGSSLSQKKIRKVSTESGQQPGGDKEAQTRAQKAKPKHCVSGQLRAVRGKAPIGPFGNVDTW